MGSRVRPEVQPLSTTGQICNLGQVTWHNEALILPSIKNWKDCIYLQFPETLNKFSTEHGVHQLLLLTFYCRRIWTTKVRLNINHQDMNTFRAHFNSLLNWSGLLPSFLADLFSDRGFPKLQRSSYFLTPCWPKFCSLWKVPIFMTSESMQPTPQRGGYNVLLGS